VVGAFDGTVVAVGDGQGVRWPLPRLPVWLHSTWLSTCSTPPGRVGPDVAVTGVAGPGVGAVAAGAAGGVVAAGPPPFSGPGAVGVVEARPGSGAGAFAGGPAGAGGAAGGNGAAAPSGIAAGGGTAARRSAPVSTPAKNRREATRTPVATFTYEPASTSGAAGPAGAAKR